MQFLDDLRDHSPLLLLKQNSSYTYRYIYSDVQICIYCIALYYGFFGVFLYIDLPFSLYTYIYNVYANL